MPSPTCLMFFHVFFRFFHGQSVNPKGTNPNLSNSPRGTHLVRDEQLAAIAVVTKPWTGMVEGTFLPLKTHGLSV